MRYDSTWWLPGLGAFLFLCGTTSATVARYPIQVDPNTVGALVLLLSGTLGFWHTAQRRRHARASGEPPAIR